MRFMYDIIVAIQLHFLLLPFDSGIIILIDTLLYFLLPFKFVFSNPYPCDTML